MNNGTMKLIGIVSWGKSCAEKHYPGNGLLSNFLSQKSVQYLIFRSIFKSLNCKDLDNGSHGRVTKSFNHIYFKLNN